MSVNLGGLGSNIKFSDLQAFYGGVHPISLSEYYRGGAEVPSTVLSGNNPYTGTTSANDSGTGTGGSNNINVTVTNRDFTSTAVAANSGVSGTVLATNPGTTSTSDGNAISGNIPAGTGATFVNFPAPGARITSATSTAASNRNGLSFFSGPGSASGSTGTNLYTNTAPRATFSGSISGVRSIFINAQNADFEPRGHNGGTYSGFQQVTTTTPTTYNVRYTNTTSFNIPSVTTNHGTFSLNAGQSRTFNNVSSNDVSRRDHAAVTQNNPRRSFQFSNGTGQNISMTVTAQGGNSTTMSLGRNDVIDINDLAGSSEAWTYSYSFQDAGSGSGTGDETNAGIVTDVTAVPGTTSTSVGSLSTTSFSGTASVNPGIINLSDLSYVYFRSEGRGNHTVVQYPQPNGGGHPTQIFSYSQDDNPGFTLGYRGPTWQSGDGSPTIRSNTTQLSGGGSIAFSGFRAPGEIGRRTVTTTTSPTTYNVSYRNTNTDAVVLSGSTTPVGAGETLAAAPTQGGAGGGMVSTTGLSSPNWSFQYRYAPGSTEANTAIPTSGEIELDQFNAPGNAAP